MYKHLTALFLLCITLPALASDSNEHWLQVRSPHFVVLTDSNEKQARRIAGQFEQMRSVFHTVMPNAASDAGSPIVVLALKDRKAFQSLEPEAYLAKGQLDLAGYFLNAPDKSYILLRLDAEGEHPFATIYHEYTHYMMRKATWLPLWLNEGLAEFYQNTDIHEKDVLLGQASPDDIYYLRQNRLLPLPTLLNVDHTSPYYHDEQKGSVFYAQSWALTHYLEVADSQKKTHRITDYAQLLIKGEDPVTAAQHAFGDLNQLQRSLQDYIQQGSFSMFKMSTGVTVDVASFEVHPVPKPDADAVRADVLVYTQRTKDAQALLETSLRDDPNNALAHETMGFLKFREHDIPAAKKWYSEAVQLDSQSFLAHYYFAAMSLQSGDRDHDATIESSLRTSIKLNPAFAPSCDTLAMFYGQRNEKLDEAHMLNIQAIQIEPENLNYRLNAASVLTQQRQYASAIGVLKQALKVTKSQVEEEMVQSRIHQLEQYQASVDRAGTQSSASIASGSMSSGSIQSPTGKTVVFRKVDGKIVGRNEDTPTYPAGDSTGAQHTVKGILRDIRCSYPNVLALTLDQSPGQSPGQSPDKSVQSVQSGKKTMLYTNNYYKVVFTTANYEPQGDIKPCTGIEDMKATIKYAEVTDKNVAGQILSIELTK
jgi:tetratricopeptide (TPR) repeat protein